MIWWHKTHIWYFYLNIKIDFRCEMILYFYSIHLIIDWTIRYCFSIISWRSHFMYGTNEIPNNISFVTVDLYHICDNHSRQTMGVLHRHVASFPRNKYETVLVRSCRKIDVNMRKLTVIWPESPPLPHVPVTLKYWCCPFCWTTYTIANQFLYLLKNLKKDNVFTIICFSSK